MTKFQAWDVYLGDRWIDTVFYDATLTSAYVRRSLIDHDGYNSSIMVVRGLRTPQYRPSPIQ